MIMVKVTIKSMVIMMVILIPVVITSMIIRIATMTRITIVLNMMMTMVIIGYSSFFWLLYGFLNKNLLNKRTALETIGLGLGVWAFRALEGWIQGSRFAGRDVLKSTKEIGERQYLAARHVEASLRERREGLGVGV